MQNSAQKPPKVMTNARIVIYCGLSIIIAIVTTVLLFVAVPFVANYAGTVNRVEFILAMIGSLAGLAVLALVGLVINVINRKKLIPKEFMGFVKVGNVLSKAPLVGIIIMVLAALTFSFVNY